MATSQDHQRFVHSLIVAPCVIGLIIDVSILVLPLLAVSTLQLSTRKKLSVYPMFMTGLLACVASVLTIYYRYVLVNTTDMTWALGPVCTVTLAELFIGIIVLCIPAAARTCRHHSAYFEKLRSISPLKQWRRGLDESPSSRRSNQYAALDGGATIPKAPMNCLKASHTAFGHGRQYNIERDDAFKSVIEVNSFQDQA